MTTDTDEIFIRHFGVSSEQFGCELEAEFERATPEERAEFEKLVDQANAVFPGMHATLDRIDASLTEMSATMLELRGSMAALDRRVSGIEARLSLPVIASVAKQSSTAPGFGWIASLRSQ